MKYPKHLHFTQSNTPLVKLKDHPFGYQLYVKRDDFTGIELSGNKVRKLDFLLQEALTKGAKRVITCGGVQSNHCRATAYMATKLGLKTTLVLKGEEPKNFMTGNFLLNRIIGADIHFISEAAYQHVDEYMAKLAGRYSEKTYVIPEGGSNALGAWGYMKAFDEITQQLPEVDAIVAPTGSIGTHAGLLFARWLKKHPCQIVSINVCDTADFFRQKLLHLAQDFKLQFAPQMTIYEDDIHIVDGFVGPGYGQVTEREISKIKEAAQKYGFLLDPVYTVKAWMGLEMLLKEGKLPGEKIVFLHTGGIFGLFAHGNRF
ncbi:1-aminocyclopropane-1-carboxylate deaminase/D-cysteine desulfhydrase [Caldithrix abyssi]